MGLGASESGGYVINGRGSLTVIRSMKLPSSKTEDYLEREGYRGYRKDMERHTENALQSCPIMPKNLNCRKCSQNTSSRTICIRRMTSADRGTRRSEDASSGRKTGQPWTTEEEARIRERRCQRSTPRSTR